MPRSTTRNLPMNDPHAAPDPIASLEALAAAVAGLEAEVERWLAAHGPALAERERALRAATHLKLHATRMVVGLDAGPAPASWQGQERRSASRATNVARLPERPAGPPGSPAPYSADWEPF